MADPVTAVMLPSAVALRTLAVPEALMRNGPSGVNRGLPLGRRDIYNAGDGLIAGVVAESGSPNRPISRRVCLINEMTRTVIAETWSDPETGGYRFESVRRDLRYTVLAYDWAHDYRAVLADNLQPEPMP